MPRQEQQVNGPKEASMARRRYQKGSLVPTRGLPTNGRWVARWREDVLQADGTVTRPYHWEILGSIQDYPTRRLALRALENCRSTINSPTYRARLTVMFAEFAKRWEATVLTQHNPSTQSSTRSQLRKWLVPRLGGCALKDLDGQTVQAFVCDCHCNAKTVRNLVATLRMMWNSAKAWGYVAHDPFDGLVLPKVTKREQPHFGLEAAKAIIERAEPPYDVALWTLFETGIRRGEVCALDVGDVHLDLTVLVVRRSHWGKHIAGNKSNRKRVCALSPQLAEKFRSLVAGRGPEEPLFTTKRGKRLHPDNFVKRVLKPILVQLKLEGGAHGFRTGTRPCSIASVRRWRSGRVVSAMWMRRPR